MVICFKNHFINLKNLLLNLGNNMNILPEHDLNLFKLIYSILSNMGHYKYGKFKNGKFR